jgi:uncharacterized protein YukE
MPLLHAEPDLLFLASRAFWQANYRAMDQLFALRVALLRLEMAWHGDTADDFFAEIAPLFQQLSGQTEYLLSMSLTLSRQTDLWDESGQRWTGIFRDLPLN